MINVEEPLQYDLNRSDDVDHLYNSYPGFDFDDLEDDECLSEFRFYKNDLPFHLGIPEVVECYQRSICSGLEALYIFLKRHSYPCRYSDMIARFGKPVPVLCMINNYMIDYIYQAHSHRILQWNDSILNPHSLEIYSNAITAKGSPLDNCFVFIDGIVRPISKPGSNQRVVYNGHKRVHNVKFQFVAYSNGIIGNMYADLSTASALSRISSIAASNSEGSSTAIPMACFLQQPFFCASLLEPGLHSLLQNSQKPRNGTQKLHSGFRQFLPTVSLSPYFHLAGYRNQQLALLLLKEDRDLSSSTSE